MAGRSLGVLTLDLVAQTAGFEAGMDKAARAADKRSKEMVASAKKIGTAFGAAIAAVGVATLALVRHTANQADAMAKSAQQAGITVESLSTLTYAAGLSGVEGDKLTSSMVRLSKSMSDASRGIGEGKEAFTAMGISVTDANGRLKDSGDMLKEVAEKFAGYKDGAEKSALAVAIFGRAGADLIPMLNSGAEGIRSAEEEARSFGLELSTKTAKAAEQFNDNMSRMGKLVEAVGLAILEDLAPAMASLSDQLAATSKETGLFRISAAFASNVVKIFATGAIATAAALISAGNALVSFGQAAQQVLSGDLSGAWKSLTDGQERSVNSIQNGAKLIESIWATTADSVVAGSEATSSGLAAPVMKGAEKAAKAGKKLKSEADKVDREAKKLADAVKAMIVDLDRQTERLGKNPTQVRLLDAWDSGATDADLKQIFDKSTAYEKQKEALEHLAKSQAGMKAVYEDTRTPIENLNIELDRLDKLLAEGMDWDVYARAVFKAHDAYDALGNKVEEVMTKADEFALQAARNIQSNLGDTLFNILDGKFDDIGSSFVKMIKRMAAEALAANLARDLFGDFAKDGKVGGWLGTAVTAIGSFFGGGKAIGGSVSGGRHYEVGEGNRPELLAMNGKQYLIPGNEGKISSGTGGGVTIHQTNSFSSNVDRSQMAAYAQRIKAATIAELRQANLSGETVLG